MQEMESLFRDPWSKVKKIKKSKLQILGFGEVRAKGTRKCLLVAALARAWGLLYVSYETQVQFMKTSFLRKSIC